MLVFKEKTVIVYLSNFMVKDLLGLAGCLHHVLGHLRLPSALWSPQLHAPQRLARICVLNCTHHDVADEGPAALALPHRALEAHLLHLFPIYSPNGMLGAAGCHAALEKKRER